MQYSDEKLREYLQWDVATWRHALSFWDSALGTLSSSLAGLQALEIGARDGGLSLWLAEKDMSVVCSDLNGPTELAFELHTRHGLKHLIEHRALDVTALDLPDMSFDVVLFKSVLGGIGAFKKVDAIELAVAELYRVLKPGGLLLFAENMCGSNFHKFARSHFVPWGRQWYYPQLLDMDKLLAGFSEFHLRSYGFFSCVKKDFGLFVALDKLVCRREISPRHYMAFGYAVK